MRTHQVGRKREHEKEKGKKCVYVLNVWERKRKRQAIGWWEIQNHKNQMFSNRLSYSRLFKIPLITSWKLPFQYAWMGEQLAYPLHIHLYAWGGGGYAWPVYIFM